MKIICCVCKKVIEDNGKDDELESHGYCQECYDIAMQEVDDWFEEERKKNEV